MSLQAHGSVSPSSAPDDGPKSRLRFSSKDHRRIRQGQSLSGGLLLLLRGRPRYRAEIRRDSDQSSESGRQFIRPKQNSYLTQEKCVKLRKAVKKSSYLVQYFKESQMRLHPERFEKKNSSQNSSHMKFEARVKTEVKSEANKVEGFEDMDDDFDA